MSPPRVLALLGDSILDNGSYTHPAPDTTAHVRRLLGSAWVVERGARDGATMTDIASQVAALPPGRPDVLVLSVGGNDLMERVGGPPFTGSLSEIFSALPEIAEEFGARYAEVLESLRPATDRLLVCTIYDVPFSDAELARLGNFALGLLNDRILLCARRFGVEVLELRDVCTEPGDFVLQIEPSAEGARKIAVAIAEAVRGSPATRSGTR
ncbi:MAG TPA: SGNH/GDSL hydrolase family protein [Planctomycetota bacterium]|nr:SGNH/GDSL hydrolase family protein [Planctomycetota bacterium]